MQVFVRGFCLLFGRNKAFFLEVRALLISYLEEILPTERGWDVKFETITVRNFLQITNFTVILFHPINY